MTPKEIPHLSPTQTKTTPKAIRSGRVTRKTAETDITLAINLDGSGEGRIAMEVGFFGHMLEQLARHALIDIDLTAKGDVHIDSHHVVEDCGRAFGSALKQALGDSRGISRYGMALLPMDESLSRVVVDICGRGHLVWRMPPLAERIGDCASEVIPEFFQGIAQTAGITLHIENLYGSNSHHIIESCFKGFARALRQAVSVDGRAATSIPSTKGVITGE